MISSLILRTTTRALVPMIAVVSLYYLFRGHDAPGGGFIGALCAGAAVVLQFLAYGAPGVRRLLPVTPGALFGGGIALAAGVGIVGLVVGGDFLQGAVVTRDLPVVGEVKVTASLPFDIGVYLVVLGGVLGIVEYLGREHEEIT